MPGPSATTAAHSTSVSASAPSGAFKRLAAQSEDQLELTERDLWEDDAGTVFKAECLAQSRLQLEFSPCRSLQHVTLICMMLHPGPGA